MTSNSQAIHHTSLPLITLITALGHRVDDTVEGELRDKQSSHLVTPLHCGVGDLDACPPKCGNGQGEGEEDNPVLQTLNSACIHWSNRAPRVIVPVPWGHDPGNGCEGNRTDG